MRWLRALPASVTGSRMRVNRPCAPFTELSGRLHVPFMSAPSGRPSLLESPVRPVPAAIAKLSEDVRLVRGGIRFTRDPTEADLLVEVAERETAVDPRARPVPWQAFGLRRRDARAGRQIAAARGALLAVAADSVRPSAPDSATWAIHGSSRRLDKGEDLVETFITPRLEYLGKPE